MFELKNSKSTGKTTSEKRKTLKTNETFTFIHATFYAIELSSF
jgi:hypothetical protein